MLVIVNTGLGNFGSVSNMLKKIGVESTISNDIDVINNASKLIMPGVGSFDYGMRRLKELNLIQVLNTRVINEKCPVLGICLGMQLMTRGSEEGTEPGLGWVDAVTVKFKHDKRNEALKTPHMGWNAVFPEINAKLFGHSHEEQRFYFVHSYYIQPSTDAIVSATCNYGKQFCCAIENGNIFGTQFHPEKSHRYGISLLKRFSEI